MRDVADQLRSWSEQLADSIQRTEFDTVVSGQATHLRQRHVRWWPFVAAATVAAALILIAVAVVGDDPTDQVVTIATEPDNVATSQPAATSSAAATESEPPPVTSELATTTTTVPQDRLGGWPAPPPGATPLAAIPHLLPSEPMVSTGPPLRNDSEPQGASINGFTQVFVDDERDALITIQTFPGQASTTPSEMAEPMTIDGWDIAITGSFVSDPATAAWLEASDPGGYVRLVGAGIGNADAASVLASMQRHEDGSPGWLLTGTAAAFVEVSRAWNGSASQRSLTWFSGTSVTAQMLSSPDEPNVISLALSGPIERVDVNGVDGWLQTSPGGRSSLVWSPDGTTVVVLGAVEPTIDLLDVARSVSAVDETRYNQATTTEPPAGLGDGCSGSLYC